MPASPAIGRRLVPSGAVVPVPQPTPVMAANTAPVGSPADPQPAAAVSATPLVDPKALMAQFDAAATPVDQHPTRTAIGRALYAFGQGMAATPQGAAYSPLGGAVAGGLAGTGQALEQQRQEDLRRQQMAYEPRRAFLEAIASETAKQGVDAPFERAKQDAQQAGQERNIRLKAQLTADMMNDQSAAKAKERGISVEDYMKLRKAAISNAMAQGLDFDSPGYQGFLDGEINRLATSAKGLGNRGLTPKPVAAVPSKAPKTAAEYLSGQ